MAKRVYKEKGGVKKYRKWKEWDVGDCVEGIYLEKYEDRFGNAGYLIEVEGAEFKDEDLATTLVGKRLGLNSCGSLDYKMEEVAIGTPVMVEYLGMEVATSGAFKGKECHNVKVSISIDDIVDGIEKKSKKDEEEDLTDAYEDMEL